ncbi:sodium/proton antiporter (CPA1 family) [Litoreibacter ponti]|uniref:Sodium/proton antiporter (CPA1 family) n=1 Tax=Litoreibacter ponti TaxID=1510457 RepID=A0A2T6BLZ6_9RHOB|nr:cation:proton antiporter [Litoreibacter ponti]PTX57103.1 sodium/proton antiporter (CPA1 family) [Litoreibacter ponti]
MAGFLIIFAATAAFAMIAKRLSATSLTAPMVFLSLGVVLAQTGMISEHDSHALLHPVAEITLVVLLFLDAAQTDFAALRRRHVWPTRMLLIGLPAAMALGTAVGLILLPAWPFVAVALLAAVLSPTDAALGQAVVTNPNVPIRPRRALTVESGLNDGLALPVVLLFASLTGMQTGVDSTQWLVFGLSQILLGPLVGAMVGAMGGWVLLQAKARATTSEIYEGIGALAMAGLAYVAAVQVGGNGFISAFVAGLVFGGIIKGACKFVYEFTESEGQMLSWASFLLLGAALVPEAVAHLTAPMLAVILISLFVARPLAIWLSLIGTDAAPVTRLFFGWFGPRGLATALFALLIVDQIPPEFGTPILHTAINAVWISAILHGITAAPAALWYGRKIANMGEMAETAPIRSSAKPVITRDSHFD